MDTKIHELMQEVESANRRCEVYRGNLLSVLKDIEEHKQLLSIKVQNVKLSMRDGPQKVNLHLTECDCLI